MLTNGPGVDPESCAYLFRRLAGRERSADLVDLIWLEFLAPHLHAFAVHDSLGAGALPLDGQPKCFATRHRASRATAIRKKPIQSIFEQGDPFSLIEHPIVGFLDPAAVDQSVQVVECAKQEPRKKRTEGDTQDPQSPAQLPTPQTEDS